MELHPRHQCLIYEGAPSLQLPALAAEIQQKLTENYRCLYLNSPAMVEGMRVALIAVGVDVAQESAKARLVLSSEVAVSADGLFDSDVMMRKLEDAIDQALRDGFKGLFATGDMSWEFGAKESFAKLIEYEWRLEKLFHKRSELCGICQYHSDTLPREAVRKGFLSHRRIFINETLSRVNQRYVESEQLVDQAAVDPDLDMAMTSLLKA